ncbi:MAG: AsmA family protein, partial [Gammaproteobacteria bacterium]|nr:AsmA family protein [Gammaproteobacteria bacterium]
MNSILKVGLWIVGVVAVLALVAIAAFALLFDPNALRDDITRLVAEKTGRELVIDGELSLSFYPWLGFAAGETSLSNAEGFNEPLMLRFDSASASVKLLPLLSRRVELSQVTLDGVELNLRRNASGQTNWDDLLELSADDTADDADKGDAAFATQSIGGVTLRDAVINFVDEQDDASYNLTAVDLEVGGIEPGEPFDFSAEGEALLSSPAMAGPFTASGTGLLGDDDSLTIGKPRFSITATGESIPGETLKLQLEANSIDVGEPDIVLDLPVLYLNGEAGGDPWNTLDATIRAPAVSLSDYDRFVVTTPTMIATVRSPTFTDSVEVELKGRTLKGAIESQAAVLDGAVIETMGMNIEAAKIDVTQFIDAPTLRGQIEIDQFKPRPVLAHFGAADIITADPAAMSAAIVSAEAFYTPDAMGLRNMTAKLDQSNIGGSVSYTTTEQVRFDLTVDSVDIDRYRSPSESTDGAAAGVEEVDIPVDVLRELNLDGTLKVGEMQLVGLQSTDVTVGIKAAGGKLRVNPSRASLYGGTYQGDISL